uniref:Acyl-CoA dehydrogenase/oxidase N-terminal domain-containing protein n=1 Tax=Acrobeloides nanus TaxID=290746 RepID=A0A914CM48_9BILA
MLRRSLSLRKVPSFRRFSAETTERKDITERKEWEIKQKEIESKIPIEKRSVSRGLALNRFEKDFLIYPEYSETDDAEKIKDRVRKIDSELRAALLLESMDKAGTLTSSVMATLLKNGIYGTFVPKEFGGENLCHKDLACIHEAIGQDLSTFLNVYNAQLATNLLVFYGSPEHRAKYLPKIASFQCKPAICMHDDLENETLASFTTSVVKGELNGTKVNVINGKNANLFLILAKNKFSHMDKPNHSWYLLDSSELGHGKVDVVDRHETHGLKALNISKLKFSNISLTHSKELCSAESTKEISAEILSSNQIYHGAAVCGFIKKLLVEITEYANRKVVGNHRLGESMTVQKAIAELGMNLFVLESIVYYLAGLLDENLILATDIENSIVARNVHRTLRQALLTIIDTIGILSTEQGFPYEQRIRDVNTYLSLCLPEFVHMKNIAIPTIESWITNTKYQNVMFKPNIVKKLIFGDSRSKDPKLQHYIAEHAHPSLAESCTRLEQTMFRFDGALTNICDMSGKRMVKEPASLWNIATVVENNFAMMACIARANRSYCIGLRNADLEITMANTYCMKANEQSKEICEEIWNNLLLSTRNREIDIGKAMLEAGGYCIEIPIEKNW